MRSSFVALTVGICLVSLHCGSDDSAATASSDGGSPNDGSSGTDSALDAPVDASKTITVNGTLVGRAGDNGPLANREVALLDATGTVTKVTTGSDGTFTVSNVMPPYDLGVPSTPPADAAVTTAYPYFYGNLTRTDPTVLGKDYTFVIPNQTPHSATISFTGCNGCFMTFSIPGDDTHVSGNGATQTASLGWYGASTTLTTSMHVFYQNPATGVLTAYVDLASVGLTDGATTALGVLGAGTAIGSPQALTLQTTYPTDYSSISTNVNLNAADRSDVTSFSSSAASSDAPLPPLSTLKVSINGYASGPNSESASFLTDYTSYATVPSMLSFTLPTAARLTAPANAATGIGSTSSLTWYAVSGSPIYEVYVDCLTSQINAWTSDTSLDLSKLAKLDIALPGATMENWGLSSASYPNVDAIMIPGQTPTLPEGTVLVTTVSATQTFTTQ